MRFLSRFPALPAMLPILPLMFAMQAHSQSLPVRTCATLQQANDMFYAAGTAALAARTQSNHRSARTVLTSNFAIHYSVAPNVHRVRWTPQDAVLRTQVDSILGSLSPTLSANQRDSSLHAALDSLESPHPLYVQRTAEYLELAWSHYDSVGMRMPAYTSTSTVFDASGQGLYVVDIADVNTAAGYSGANYGLTRPPAFGGSILVENDFLYNASYDPVADQVNGLPVQPVIAGQQRNYHIQWDMGLKVTLIHEFYHSVQFGYTATLPNPIHAWYELSAVSMEERLAPEVNDYFQYLPSVIPNNATVNVLNPIDGSARNYGNGIFHMFLTHTLGAGVDRPIWEALDANGNNLPDALIQGIGSQARWDSLYSAYAAAMSLSGSQAALTSPLAFTPDMAQWPRPRFDSVPENGTSHLNVLPGTYRLIRPSETGGTWAGIPGIAGAWRVTSAGDEALFLTGANIPLQGAGNPVLAVANPAFPGGDVLVLSVTVTGDGFSAHPNPADSETPFIAFSTLQEGPVDSLHVVSESGDPVAILIPDSTGMWKWDLKDTQERRVAPGVYQFHTPGYDARPLLVTP